MYNQNKILRVLQLISLLKTKPAKSIRHLSEIIDSTERTMYRYLELLTEVGFHIDRDNYNRVFIESDTNANELHFNQDELQLLKQLVLTVGKESILKDAILKKLYVVSDIQMNSQHLLKAHLGKIIEMLSTAIQSKRQVILKKYHSVNSNNISDRLVEPIKFTDNYHSLVAYEVITGKNKYFNIERITGIEITKHLFKFSEQHQYSTPDVFGFSETGEHHHVNLLMSLRPYVLLKEEYPMTTPFINYEHNSKLYCFKTTVYDLKPITRFVLGFLDEITVIGSAEFKTHLRNHVNGLLKGNE